jgi:hypothetical protein
MSNALLLPAEAAYHRKMVQEALPGFMYALLFSSLRTAGYEVRADLEELANKCSAAALAQALGPKQAELSVIVQRDGYAILKDAGENHMTVLLGGLSRCLVKMVDQGRAVNADATIIALAICAEMDDGVEDWGKPRQANRAMSALDNQFTRMGYFKSEGLVFPG